MRLQREADLREIRRSKIAPTGRAYRSAQLLNQQRRQSVQVLSHGKTDGKRRNFSRRIDSTAAAFYSSLVTAKLECTFARRSERPRSRTSMNTSRLHDSSTTNSLLGLANSGDEHAFAQLFARHEDALRRLIKHRIEAGLARRFDASDVVQETRVAAFQRLGDFVKRRPMPLAIWLQRTCSNSWLTCAGIMLTRPRGLYDASRLGLIVPQCSWGIL